MRTKALLLAAAFAAAGVATSMAQVYSVNAVGYVNTTLVPGFNLISNPLTAADNTIQTLFNNFQGGPRDGTIIYRFNNGGFENASYDGIFQVWSGSAATETTVPGEGVYVFLPGPIGAEAANKVLTFVGEVPQSATSTPLPRGFSIKSSVVPQALSPDNVKNTDGSSAAIPAADGDILYQWDSIARKYNTFSYDGVFNVWSPSLPTLKVGEAFFYFRLGAATTWNRTFDVNNPQ
jgi:hypothetical protein